MTWAKRARELAVEIIEFLEVPPTGIKYDWYGVVNNLSTPFIWALRLAADEWEAGNPERECPKCGGDGEVEHYNQEDSTHWWSKCEPCNGTGKVRE